MVTLSELTNLSYLPTSQLPPEHGSWVLCKLIQYPMKDDKGIVVEGEWRQPSYSSLFANAVIFRGKTTTRTTWITGQQQVRREVQVLSLADYTDEDIHSLIADGHLYIYMNAADKNADPLTVDEYAKLVQSSQQAVMPQAEPVPTQLQAG